MPVFAAMVSTLFGALSVFLAKLFAAKLAVRLVAVIALGAVAASLMNVFNTQLAPLVQALFSTQYGQFLGLAFPPIAGTVVATVTTLWLAVNSYQLQSRAIRLTANL